MSVIYRPAEQEHADEFRDCSTRCLLIEFAPCYIGELAARMPQFTTPTMLVDLDALRRVPPLLREWHFSDAATPLAIESLTLEFLGGMARGGECLARQNVPPRWLMRAREALDNGYSTALDLGSLAGLADVHPAHLARAFRRFYRCSVGEYVRQRRIEFACQELKSPSSSLAEIASASGYSDQAHFSRAFRRIMKVTPGQFRRSQRFGRAKVH